MIHRCLLWSVFIAALMPMTSLTGFAAESAKAESGLYEPSWESLKRHAIPEWLEDAKFGIWTHWGVYAVPAYATEWYPHFMYDEGHDINKFHKEHFGDPTEYGYEKFVPQFTARKFDAREWARLFKKAGARFAGPVAEHHDGFAMWDCAMTKWDAADMGPGVDIVGEMADAIRAEGMTFVTSLHHFRKWWYYETSYTYGDGVSTRDPKYANLYGLFPPPHEAGASPSVEYMMMCERKVIEVIDKYHPAVLFFDSGPAYGMWGSIQDQFEQSVLSFIAYYYNMARQWGQEVTVVYESDDMPKGVRAGEIGIRALERTKLDEASDEPWMTVTSVDDKSWGYVRNPKYRSADQLVDLLIDIVSKNGVLWLNIGPKPDGTIAEPVRERLLEIGEWLGANGEAIYATRPWKTYKQGDDIRFTRNKKGDVVYVICLEKPEGSLTLRSLGYDAGKVKAASLLGADDEIEWTQMSDGLTIDTPPNLFDSHAWVFKVRLED